VIALRHDREFERLKTKLDEMLEQLCAMVASSIVPRSASASSKSSADFLDRDAAAGGACNAVFPAGAADGGAAVC
jgi:hypothetical protein